VLVLSRKLDQSLHLGDEIVVTVLGIDGDRVKLGIDAPRAVAVLRHEVFTQVQNANADAAAAVDGLKAKLTRLA
jgi:carbon storage regulator